MISGLPFGLKLCEYVHLTTDTFSGTLSFRVQELNVRVESKTLDNVFLTATVSVQYCVLAEKVTDAFYELTNPVS